MVYVYKQRWTLLGIPVHCRRGIITNIITDSYSSQKQFHCNVLTLAVIHKDTILLHRWQDNRNVGFGFCAEGLKLNPGSITRNTDACQDFASFPRVAWGTFTSVVWTVRGQETEAMHTVIILTRWCLWIEHCHAGKDLTIATAELIRALTSILVNTVRTSSSILNKF